MVTGGLDRLAAAILVLDRQLDDIAEVDFPLPGALVLRIQV